MVDLLELLRKEGGAIKAAPMSVVVLMIVAAIAAGSVANYLSAREVTILHDQLDAAKGQLDATKDQRDAALRERQFYLECMTTGLHTPVCKQAIKDAPPAQDSPRTPAPPPNKPSPGNVSSPPRPSPKTVEAKPPKPPLVSNPTPPPAPIYGVLHLDATKLRLSLKKATNGVDCHPYGLYVGSPCYGYKIYISGQEISSADSTTINVQYPAEYKFEIVVRLDTNDLIPIFAHPCGGNFKVTDSASFMEVEAHIEPLDPRTKTFRFRDCAVVAQ